MLEIYYTVGMCVGNLLYCWDVCWKFTILLGCVLEIYYTVRMCVGNLLYCWDVCSKFTVLLVTYMYIVKALIANKKPEDHWSC